MTVEEIIIRELRAIHDEGGDTLAIDFEFEAEKLAILIKHHIKQAIEEHT